LDNVIIQKIQFEIEQIDELIDASKPLFDLCKVRDPDFVERCGIALILQSFYNGIEKMMLLIVKNKDKKLPNGIKWHKELFDNTFKKNKNRTHIFREELYEQLNDYLQFRHFVRHAYGFKLKWEKMKNILFDMNTLWENIKEDINVFIKNN
jgi:hypothetical protein